MIRKKAQKGVTALSKPRACGDDPDVGQVVASGSGVNPARAGMILAVLSSESIPVCKPRACGDDPLESPSEPRKAFVNPARAGMILTISEPPINGLCKPRACGDDPTVAGLISAIRE